MNNLLEIEYKWINDELEKIIANKNQFTPEVIKSKINIALTTIIDIDEKLKNIKISKFKKISYSILKIFTFGKIDNNKIIKKKNDYFIEMKNKLNENFKKISQLYIRKSNKDIEIVDKAKKEINSTNLQHQSLTSNTKSKLLQM